MSTRAKRWRIAAAIVGCALAGLYGVNASWLAPSPESAPRLFAHRGLAQTFDLDGVDGQTCTASRIHEPAHGFIENTVAGIEAAFEAGADWVEIDVRPTADGQLAVFHDYDLACRTDGSGEISEHTMAQLRALDVGYGYTADGGQTFPLRGRGVGLLPSLPEVFAAFPGRSFVLDIKDGGAEVGDRVADLLDGLDPELAPELVATGGGAATQRLQQRRPRIRTFTAGSAKSCLVGYLATGWLGRTPHACRDTLVLVPVNAATWLWGWPRRLESRMHAVGSDVVLIGPWHGERHSRGVDDLAWLESIPSDFGGGIWTNRVDLLGPALRPTGD
jgi:glycerophosphoryl diester phosphodiesterase